LPLAWKLPPFKLNVKLLLPLAEAEMDPFDCPLVALFVVPETVMVTPAHGFGGGSGDPPPLLQEICKSRKLPKEVRRRAVRML
jgi:hypothetical protein